jgi:hypothetical protein
MSIEQEPRHRDSRNPEGEARVYRDFTIELEDHEIIEASPFRPALERLKELGLTKVIIGHPDEEDEPEDDDPNKWWVYGIREFPGTQPMVSPYLGGDLEVLAEITTEGKRVLEFSFGAGDLRGFDPEDLNEDIWSCLEVIHKMVSSTAEGQRLPVMRNRQPE